MEVATQSRRAVRCGAGLALGLLAACAHGPFARHPVPAPQPVDELRVEAGEGSSAQLLQFWERNTLVVDLRSVSGSGSATLTPRPRAGWPVRLAFRVVPGSIGELDVKGAQRAVFMVEGAAGAPLDLKLDPGVYTPRTPAITLVWGPRAVLSSPPPVPGSPGRER
jgi:hypothetical protein